MFTRSAVGAAPLAGAIAAAALAAAVTTAAPARAAAAPEAAPTVAAAPGEVTAGRQLSLSIGSGHLMRLPRPAASVFVADEKVADVQVKNPQAFYLFAKTAGLTSVYATDRAGQVIWSSDVRVGANIADVAGMLAVALPESDIKVTPVSGMILLTGTVLGPKDAAEAERLTEQFTAKAVPILNRLAVATPQQVMLRVRVAEVSRNLMRQIGVNFANSSTGSPKFGFFQGTPGTPGTGTGASSSFTQLAGTTLGLAGRAFGANIISTLQLYENNGDVHTLAEPTLMALSGETASFLAGGEIPIPQSQGLGSISVEYKEYGVSLAFSPVVMSGGRIVLRVRPEVSQLSSSGSVTLNGFNIPALSTRRAETTVELGSGQSFMIGGLLQNDHSNSVQKAPLLGNLPILGALFRSTSFQKSETELVIIVTPYLVRAADADRIVTPIDGYQSPTLAQRTLLDQTNDAPAPRPAPAAAPAARR